MTMLKSILLAGGALLACAAVAQAADLPTKKGVAPAPAKIVCDGFWNWFQASAADCPLTYWGVTFYGQVDVGGGYESNGAKFDKWYPNGVSELISNVNHGSKWQFVPNGLSQSNLGVKWKEPLGSDWFFVGDVNFGFDPYSLHFADGPRSLEDNNTLNQWQRSANGDSSRTYGPINTRAWAGFSNKTWGTLTYGRHYAFSNDNDNAYDPFGGAYAFSLIGNSGTLGGGLGDTEMARFNNSIRYLYADHNIRAGVLSQVGGWSAGNNAKYAVQGDLGFDWQGFSVDGVYSYDRDAVALGILGSAGAGAIPAPLATNTLSATIETINAFQIAGKYKWEQFTLFGGTQYSSITNPDAGALPTSFSVAGSPVRDFNGGFPAVYGTAVQTSSAVGLGLNNAFPVPRHLSVSWIGGKWTPVAYLDFAAGYYHVWQNDYLGATQTATSCIANTSLQSTRGAPVGSGLLKGTNSGKCAGTEDAISGLVDWHITKRFDLYGGVMFSKVRGGLASGFFADNNTAVTSGVRLSF
jgi:predicted porin